MSYPDKWWSKSQPQLKKEDSKNSQNPTEGSNKDEIVCNRSEAEPGTSKGKQAERILDSLQKLEVILKDANISREDFSPQKLLSTLQGGILLKKKRQKYWVDKMGKNCFMIYPRDFQIIWSQDERYWCWLLPEEASGDDAIEMAQLTGVWWLDVSGSFDTTMLSPETLYEASFVVMMKNDYGWNTPVAIQITDSNGSRREQKVKMSYLPKEQWVELPVAKFGTLHENLGNMRFVMAEHKGLSWKRGLIFKGFKIQAKIA